MARLLMLGNVLLGNCSHGETGTHYMNVSEKTYFIVLLNRIGVRIIRERHPQMKHNDTENVTITI